MARQQMSDARVALLAVMAFGTIMTTVAFFTPNWLASDSRLYGAEFDRLGLWESCFRSLRDIDDYDLKKFYSGCRWIFSWQYKEIRSFLEPPFFIATQTLFTIGFVFLLLGVIGVLAIQLCFVVEKERYAMRVLAAIMLLAATFSTTAVVVFGILGDNRDWMPDSDHNFLSWSFGLAVVGSFFQWVSAILFWVESRILTKKDAKKQANVFTLESTTIKA